MIKSPHPAVDLSFMCLRKVGGGIVYWNVETTGSYSTDYKHGELLGKEFLDYIGRHPTVFNSTLLGCIVLDMEAHAAKGIKLGFMRSINDYAMGAAKVMAALDFGKLEKGYLVPGHSLPAEAAAMGETFQPHQNGEAG